MIRYPAVGTDLADDDLLWESFMCFVRSVIPYEQHWNELTEEQKHPLVVFIYTSEVTGEGHIGFLDLHSAYIDSGTVLRAMEALGLPDAYTNIVRSLPLWKLSVDDLAEQADDEDEFEQKMEELDQLFEASDQDFYRLFSREEIDGLILAYVRSSPHLFFEPTDS